MVTILKGSPKVELSGDEELIDKTTVKIEGSTLVVRKEGSWRGSGRDVEVTIYFREIEDLEISGACQFRSQDPINARDFDLEVSGASKATFELIAGDLSAEVSGASTIDIYGEVDSQDLEVSGASNFRGDDLTSGDCRVESSGASTVLVHVKERLRADASGASSVRYTGNPRYVDAETSGASSVKGRN